ncbi:MAG: hypothetical protein M1347_02020 [Chloroflexi bacterium]|nr:hypothetical protein [Chloroflexota bacterium]
MVLLLAINIAKPNLGQLGVLILLVVTWWPLQLYIPSNMQEVVHMSAAILVAALFYRYMTDPKIKTRYAVYIGLLLLFLIPLRFIWGFLVFPLILFYPIKKDWKTWLMAFVGTGLVLLAGAAFVRIFYSYYPWYSNELLDLLLNSPLQGIREMIRHFTASIGQLFSLNQGLPLVILVRYQIIGLLIAVVAWLVLIVRSKTGISWDRAREPLFHAISLVSVLAFVLFFYDVLDTRDYRMFISPLLLSCILLILLGRLKFVYPIIALNVVFVFSFLSYYPVYRYPNFHVDPQLLSEVHRTINPYLQFDSVANRWCNTISISKYGDVQAIGYPLTAIQSGFGITTILDWKELSGQPLKAKYVLMDPVSLMPDFGKLANRFDLLEINQTPLGTLYINPHADCE